MHNKREGGEATDSNFNSKPITFHQIKTAQGNIHDIENLPRMWCQGSDNNHFSTGMDRLGGHMIKRHGFLTSSSLNTQPVCNKLELIYMYQCIDPFSRSNCIGQFICYNLSVNFFPWFSEG